MMIMQEHQITSWWSDRLVDQPPSIVTHAITLYDDPKPLYETRFTTSEGDLVLRVFRDPPWLFPFLAALHRAAQLESNWDSYGAIPVRARTVIGSVSVMDRIMQDDSPEPSVVPLADGGVQLEWHRGGVDLEIEVGSDGRPSGYYRRGDLEWEEDEPEPLIAQLIQAIPELNPQPTLP